MTKSLVSSSLFMVYINRQLEQQLLEVRQQHQEQLRSAELAREEAELRAIQIQQQQEQRSLRI